MLWNKIKFYKFVFMRVTLKGVNRLFKILTLNNFKKKLKNLTIFLDPSYLIKIEC